MCVSYLQDCHLPAEPEHRKLRELDYCTSYSHRGRFYTLRELAEFDENGLWWIRSVGFSSRGTLVATAEGLVNASEAGYAVEELDAIVRVGTKDVLPKLAWEKRLRRTRIRNRNVYFSPKRSIREQQIASRRVWEAQPSVSKSIAAQDVLPDELKAAIILLGVTLILTPIIANCVSARHCRES